MTLEGLRTGAVEFFKHPIESIKKAAGKFRNWVVSKFQSDNPTPGLRRQDAIRRPNHGNTAEPGDTKVVNRHIEPSRDSSAFRDSFIDYDDEFDDGDNFSETQNPRSSTISSDSESSIAPLFPEGRGGLQGSIDRAKFTKEVKDQFGSPSLSFDVDAEIAKAAANAEKRKSVPTPAAPDQKSITRPSSTPPEGFSSDSIPPSARDSYRSSTSSEISSLSPQDENVSISPTPPNSLERSVSRDSFSEQGSLTRSSLNSSRSSINDSVPPQASLQGTINSQRTSTLSTTSEGPDFYTQLNAADNLDKLGLLEVDKGAEDKEQMRDAVLNKLLLMAKNTSPDEMVIKQAQFTTLADKFQSHKSVPLTRDKASVGIADEVKGEVSSKLLTAKVAIREAAKAEFAKGLPGLKLGELQVAKQEGLDRESERWAIVDEITQRITSGTPQSVGPDAAKYRAALKANMSHDGKISQTIGEEALRKLDWIEHQHNVIQARIELQPRLEEIAKMDLKALGKLDVGKNTAKKEVLRLAAIDQFSKLLEAEAGQPRKDWNAVEKVLKRFDSESSPEVQVRYQDVRAEFEKTKAFDLANAMPQKALQFEVMLDKVRTDKTFTKMEMVPQIPISGESGEATKRLMQAYIETQLGQAVESGKPVTRREHRAFEKAIKHSTGAFVSSTRPRMQELFKQLKVADTQKAEELDSQTKANAKAFEAAIGLQASVMDELAALKGKSIKGDDSLKKQMQSFLEVRLMSAAEEGTKLNKQQRKAYQDAIEHCTSSKWKGSTTRPRLENLLRGIEEQ